MRRQGSQTQSITLHSRILSTRIHSVSCHKVCLDFDALADSRAPAVDTTFINVVVWNSDRLFPEFNPGNMDPNTGAVITGEIVKAFVAEPDYSPLKMNIERNLEYFGRAILAMDRINFRTWWQGPPRESMTNSSVTNLTDSMNDLSLSANVTSAINLTASMADLTLPANVTLPVNFTILGLNSTSICAGAGQRITPGCTGQDNDLLSTS